MLEVKKQIQKLSKEFNFLNCLETGTIRTYTERHESTRHISEVIGINGTLKSIDIDPKSIMISQTICNNAKNVEWVLSDSIEYLKIDKDIYHFVLLDSVNDPAHIFKEFKLVAKKMYLNGVVMVDDAGVDFNKVPLQSRSSHRPIKGLDVNSFLLENDFDYSIVRGGHAGNQLFIKMDENNLAKINELL